MWCLPAGADPAFVAAMEDVLDVYERPYDPFRPVVCGDEAGKQLVIEARDPLPPLPGSVAKHDAEYVRNGTANLFMFTEPLAGWRQVTVTDTRTRVDFAHVDPRPGRRPVQVRDQGRAGPGQPEHALGGQPVRGVPARPRPSGSRTSWRSTTRPSTGRG